MEFLTEFLDIVAMVPGTFWGVIVGSFFSIGAVMLSNRASDRRLRAQFAYERELRISDSELALRKEIYLAATEAISAGLQSVAKMADLEILTSDVTDEYIKKSPAISKVHIIGNISTISATIDISSELARTQLRLMTMRMLLISKKQEITQLDEMIEKFGQERDRMIEAMKQYNLQGSTDQRLWDTIERSLNFEQDRINETLAQKSKLSAALIAGQLDCARKSSEEVIRLNRFLVPIVIEVRKELSIPIEEEDYEKIIEKAGAIQSDNITEFLGQVQAFTTAHSEPVEDGPDMTPVS